MSRGTLKAELKKRRTAVASKSNFSLPTDIYEGLTMERYNSKVDLRPSHMKSENNYSNGKPPVDSVLQPSERMLNIQIKSSRPTATELQNVKLRKVGDTNLNSKTKEDESISERLNKEIEEKLKSIAKRNQDKEAYAKESTIENRDESVESVKSKDKMLETELKEIPPSPPLPISNNSIKEHTMNKVKDEFNYYDQSQQSEDDRKSQLSIRSSKREEEITMLKAELEKLKQNLKNHEIDEEIQNEINDKEQQDSIMYNDWLDEVRKRMERDELEDPNTMRTKRKRNRGSDREEKKKEADIRMNMKERRNTRMRSPSRARSISQMSITNAGEKSSIAGSVKSFKSATKSIKSVLFKRTEEEEIRSEVSDDDIADKDEGNIGFIDYAYDRFTLHGPFIDHELNVFHAICQEYRIAAEITFAKRSVFSRTKAAYQRVYALVGSDRRSSWTNRSDWNKTTNNLQVLDYIFRGIIRSRTKRITDPKMELEHFEKGKILDVTRFRRVMLAIFRRRDHLIKTLNIEMIEFNRIE